MNVRWISWTVGLLAAPLALVGTSLLLAGDCPHCQEGTCYREVVTYRCKLVPDHKPIKKTVYECKEVPYCEHKLSRHGDCCPECHACPKFKKVLVKREIVVGETCGTKCVPEAVVERIPVPCCRCGHQPGPVQAPSPVQAPAPVIIGD